MLSWKQQEEGEEWGYKKGSVGCKEQGLRGKSGPGSATALLEAELPPLPIQEKKLLFPVPAL